MINDTFDFAGPANSSTIITCSSDGTVKLWTLGDGSSSNQSSASPAAALAAALPPNAVNHARLARTLRGVLYANLVEQYGPNGEGLPGGTAGGRMCTPESPLPVPAAGGKEIKREASVTLRCLKISHDGRHVATGMDYGARARGA